MSLHNNAVLVSIKLTKLGVTRKDKQATTDVTDSNKAQRGSAKVTKELLPNNQLLRQITQCDSAIRQVVVRYALPWDAASYLLPTKHFLHFKADISSLLKQREGLVTDFISDYPVAVADAFNTLGDLYNPNDYPHPSDVPLAFTASVDYAPIPMTRDFRVEASQELVSEMEASYQAAMDTKLADVKRATWQRVYNVTNALVDRLTDDDNAVSKTTKTGAKVFRDSLVDNANELMGLLDGFNIEGDTVMGDAAAQLRVLLQGITPSVLRNSATTRAEVAGGAAVIQRTADDILNNMSMVWGDV